MYKKYNTNRKSWIYLSNNSRKAASSRRERVTLSQICVHIILGKPHPWSISIFYRIIDIYPNDVTKISPELGYFECNTKKIWNEMQSKHILWLRENSICFYVCCRWWRGYVMQGRSSFEFEPSHLPKKDW